MSVVEHKREAPSRVRCKVVTVSDTRTEATDKSGALIKQLLVFFFKQKTAYEIVSDEQAAIREAIVKWLVT
nr:hypothetical protein [Numidum massiliense]